MRDLNGDGLDDVVLANQALDRVTVHFREPGSRAFGAPALIAAGDMPLLAPGAVQLVDLDADPYPDLVVVNRRANSVLVYPGLAGGNFARARAYDVGFEPVGLVVADLTGDGVLDLAIANHGSNDISVLVGARDASGWSAAPGPRLDAGGFGPLAVTARDVTGDAIPDLLVANESGRLTALPGIGSAGRGSGFFRDAAPQALDLQDTLQQALLGTAGQGLLLGSDGALRRFDPVGFDVQMIFDGPPVARVSPFGFGALLAVAFRDGDLGLLRPDEDGRYELAGRFDGFSGEPGALEVLQRGDDLDVYVSRRGEDVPVVLGRADFIALVTELSDPPLLAEGTPLPGARLLLVATLVPGLQRSRPEEAVDPAPLADGSFELFFQAIPVDPRAFEGFDQSLTPDDTIPETGGAETPLVVRAGGESFWSGWQLGLDESLQRLVERARSREDDRSPGDPLDRLPESQDPSPRHEEPVPPLEMAACASTADARLAASDRPTIMAAFEGRERESLRPALLPTLVAVACLGLSLPFDPPGRRRSVSPLR